jgi:hypothetical protein
MLTKYVFTTSLPEGVQIFFCPVGIKDRACTTLVEIQEFVAPVSHNAFALYLDEPIHISASLRSLFCIQGLVVVNAFFMIWGLLDDMSAPWKMTD